MPEYVRVSDKETRHHYTITRERFDGSPDLWDELKQPATDAAGDPLPPKYRTSVSTETEKRAGSTATSEKENS